MSNGITYLHSHSGIERTLKDDDVVKKRVVIVDEKYEELFGGISEHIEHCTICGKKYIKVPILAFVMKGGVFKNLDS